METVIFYVCGAAFIGVCAWWIKSDNDKNNRPTYRRGDMIVKLDTNEIGIINGVDNSTRVLHTTIGGLHFSKVRPLIVGNEVTILKTKKRVKIWGFDGAIVNTSFGRHHYLTLKA